MLQDPSGTRTVGKMRAVSFIPITAAWLWTFRFSPSLSDLRKEAEIYVAALVGLFLLHMEGNQSFLLKSLFSLYQQLDSCLHFSHSKIIMFPLWQRKLSFISRESYTRSRQNTSVNNKSNDDWTFQGAFTSFRYFRALRSISETNTLQCIC